MLLDLQYFLHIALRCPAHSLLLLILFRVDAHHLSEHYLIL